MISHKTNFKVGVFVIIGFSILGFALVWLGMSSYFEKGEIFVTYFKESIQGLNKDSSVKYLGVKIGRVVNMEVGSTDNYVKVLWINESKLKIEPEKVIAQLRSIGITGIKYIEIEKNDKNDDEMVKPLYAQTKYPIIYSKPSGLKRMFEGLGGIVKKVNSINLDNVILNVNSTLEELKKVINDANVKKISEKFLSSLNTINKGAQAFSQVAKKADKTVENVNSLIKGHNENINLVIKNLADSTKNAKVFFKNGTNLINDGTGFINNADDSIVSINYQLVEAIKNFQHASTNLNDILGILNNQPSQFLLGEPVKPRKLD